jgi:lysophosphatidate acyltransferase
MKNLFSKIQFFTKAFLVLIWFLCVALPFLILLLTQPSSRSFAQKFCLAFRWGVLKIGGLQLVVHDSGKLIKDQSVVFVGNHQSWLDVVTLGGLFPYGTVGVGKKEIANIPIFGSLFKLNGHILIDRKNNQQSVQELKTALKRIVEEKRAIVILPEGTRNPAGEGLLPFKKGAFYLAIQGQIPIQPVICSELKDILNTRKMIFKSGVIHLWVGDLIETKGLTLQEVDALSNQVRQVMLDSLQRFS